MTTKPKARKFRIRRNEANNAPKQPVVEDSSVPTEDAAVQPDATLAPPNEGAPAVEPEMAPSQPGEDLRARIGVPASPAPSAGSQSGEVSSAAQVMGETDIEAIRREGLTGRQLRMARRVAQKRGLAPTSDFDAVRLLRLRGLDPFQSGNVLELVAPQDTSQPPIDQAQSSGAATGDVQLPQTIRPNQIQVPPTDELNPIERRMHEVAEIQRDITRRRRKRVILLLVRLAFFVFLPTFLTGYYFFNIATPMYSTKSAFSIITNEGGGGGGRLGGLLPSQFSTSQDAIIVQDYLTSRDAMLRLDRDLDYKAQFTQADIDPIQRLAENATNESTYGIYKRNVKIGYDPTEGVMRMEVIAPSPEASAHVSEQLIVYAEERVNSLSQQKREDQMRDARIGLERAEEKRRAAQEDLVRLQIESSTLDPESIIASLRAQISQIETELITKEIELSSLLNNIRPNTSRVNAARGDIEIFERQLAKLNAKMTDVSQGQNSLAELAARIQLAQADLASRDLILQSALQTLESARAEASKQVRYLVVGVEPVAPDEASHPKSFENTILAFLIFAGIYLVISLTASILREQVTS